MASPIARTSARRRCSKSRRSCAKLGPDADRAGALFITVDPERDTPKALKDYLSSFDPRISALTGDAAAIAAVAKAYRAITRRCRSEGGYTMDHTAIVYLMDKEGRFVTPFSLKRTPEAAAADLRRISEPPARPPTRADCGNSSISDAD